MTYAWSKDFFNSTTQHSAHTVLAMWDDRQQPLIEHKIKSRFWKSLELIRSRYLITGKYIIHICIAKTIHFKEVLSTYLSYRDTIFLTIKNIKYLMGIFLIKKPV